MAGDPCQWTYLRNLGKNTPWSTPEAGVNTDICLLFTILHPFGTKESIRRKVDHEGQIVLLGTLV
jgi:hypothetical protein